MKNNPCYMCDYAWKYKGRHFGSTCFECRHCEKIRLHKEYLQSQRKFVAGKRIDTLDELLKQEWIIWGDSTRHIEMIKSLQLRMIVKFLEAGWFRTAIRKEESNE